MYIYPNEEGRGLNSIVLISDLKISTELEALLCFNVFCVLYNKWVFDSVELGSENPLGFHIFAEFSG